MNTNSLKTSQDIKSAFSSLFENRTEQERRDDAAQMLSFRYLSEIERLMEAYGMTKRRLAEAVGTSPSYITQLFRGDRLLNFEMLARLEDALSVKFTVEACQPVALPVEYDYNDAVLPPKPARHLHHVSPFTSYSVSRNAIYAKDDILTDNITDFRQAS